VDLGETEGQQTSSSRPLQGQSPHVANVLLGYDHEATRSVVNAIYNVAGPRIVEVGTAGIPDTFELPFHSLDLVYTQGLGEHWKVRLKGSNLLQSSKRERTGDTVSMAIEPLWSVGLGVTWTPI
jgi:hypothetical protein